MSAFTRRLVRRPRAIRRSPARRRAASRPARRSRARRATARAGLSARRGSARTTMPRSAIAERTSSVLPAERERAAAEIVEQRREHVRDRARRGAADRPPRRRAETRRAGRGPPSARAPARARASARRTTRRRKRQTARQRQRLGVRDRDPHAGERAGADPTASRSRSRSARPRFGQHRRDAAEAGFERVGHARSRPRSPVAVEHRGRKAARAPRRCPSTRISARSAARRGHRRRPRSAPGSRPAGSKPGHPFGPLDQRDPVGTEASSSPRSAGLGRVVEPVEVEVFDRGRALVALAEDEGRARDRVHRCRGAPRRGRGRRLFCPRRGSPESASASPGAQASRRAGRPPIERIRSRKSRTSEATLYHSTKKSWCLCALATWSSVSSRAPSAPFSRPRSKAVFWPCGSSRSAISAIISGASLPSLALAGASRRRARRVVAAEPCSGAERRPMNEHTSRSREQLDAALAEISGRRGVRACAIDGDIAAFKARQPAAERPPLMAERAGRRTARLRAAAVGPVGTRADPGYAARRVARTSPRSTTAPLWQS